MDAPTRPFAASAEEVSKRLDDATLRARVAHAAEEARKREEEYEARVAKVLSGVARDAPAALALAETIDPGLLDGLRAMSVRERMALSRKLELIEARRQGADRDTIELAFLVALLKHSRRG